MSGGKGKQQHIHYIDSPDSPKRLLIELDESVPLNHPYGSIDLVR